MIGDTAILFLEILSTGAVQATTVSNSHSRHTQPVANRSCPQTRSKLFPFAVLSSCGFALVGPAKGPVRFYEVA